MTIMDKLNYQIETLKDTIGKHKHENQQKDQSILKLND